MYNFIKHDISLIESYKSVSYTHLDVYKRQDFMFVANVMYCFEISSRNLKKKRGDIFRHELHGLTLLIYSYDNTKDSEFCVIRA